jgi:hypothetical protein
MKTAGVKHILFLLLVIVLFACNNNNNNNNPKADTLPKPSFTDTIKANAPLVTQKDILDTLNELPFVKESNRYVDSLTNHQHGIAYLTDTTDKEYNITAGYNGPERFETYYIFSVDKKTRAIKVQDVISGEMVTADEFEKLLKSKQ